MSAKLNAAGRAAGEAAVVVLALMTPAMDLDTGSFGSGVVGVNDQ
jgi:hypothetical protein